MNERFGVCRAHVFSAGDEEPTDLTLDEDFASLNKDADITITRTDYRHLRPQCERRTSFSHIFGIAIKNYFDVCGGGTCR